MVAFIFRWKWFIFRWKIVHYPLENNALFRWKMVCLLENGLCPRKMVCGLGNLFIYLWKMCIIPLEMVHYSWEIVYLSLENDSFTSGKLFIFFWELFISPKAFV